MRLLGSRGDLAEEDQMNRHGIGWGSGILAIVAAASSMGCNQASEDADDTDDGVAGGESAFTASSSDFHFVTRPAGMPEAWQQPDSEGEFNRYGKCGQTAIANMLRLNSLELSPKEIFDGGVRSLIGLFPSEMEKYFTAATPQLNPKNGHGDSEEPLQTLKDHLTKKHAVAIVMGVDGLNAHWVNVVGIRGESSPDPRLVIQTWGRYAELNWSVVEKNWRRVLTFGSYPYVVLETPAAAPIFVE
jgi:hypothetical protein